MAGAIRMFVHTVYFWMKSGATETDRRQLVNDCIALLGKVPAVRQIFAGRPAMTPREVVDNSYGVGLTVLLDDKAGHDAYQEHPLHQEFIKRNKQHWDRVQIYDYV
jgi:hypothetical protein